MRDIKFRAWDTTSVKGKMIEVRSLQFNDFVNVNGGSPFELMQYTGLKDKNGKEIYEGDILQYITPEDYGEPSNERYKVEWLSYGFGAIWLNPPNPNASNDLVLSLQDPNNDMEVIGNIWENGDLLND